MVNIINKIKEKLSQKKKKEPIDYEKYFNEVSLPSRNYKGDDIDLLDLENYNEDLNDNMNKQGYTEDNGNRNRRCELRRKKLSLKPKRKLIKKYMKRCKCKK